VTKQNTKSFSEPVLDGMGELYLMPRSGNVYQLRVWLPSEKKYLRRSLKTRLLDDARRRARDEVFRIHKDINDGKKQFGINLGELIDEYLEWRSKDVRDNIITAGRFTTIRSQCRAILRTMSSETRVGELDQNSFFDWGQMRRTDNPTITQVTIRNETATLGQIFDYAFRKGYTNFPKMLFRPSRITLDQIGRRDVFTEDEYSRLTHYFKTFVSKSMNDNPELRLERMKVRDYILILSNTLLRTGELRQLKWADILGFKDDIDDAGQKITLVNIRIRKEISKTRIARDIWVRGGEYVQRLKEYSPFTSSNDLLFTNRDGTHPFGTRELYKYWYELMSAIGIENHKQRKLSYYSLRHYGITYKMKQGTPIADIAYIARTSVTHIEQHYRHVDDEVMLNVARRNKPKSF